MTEFVWTTPTTTIVIDLVKYFGSDFPPQEEEDILLRLASTLGAFDCLPLSMGGNHGKHEIYLCYEDADDAVKVHKALDNVRLELMREERRERMFKDLLGKKPKRG